jgi:hypothetical protein
MRRAIGISPAPGAQRRAGFDLRQLGCLVMLLAILIRAAVPAGFMPVFDTDHRIMTVAMCSGHADQTIQIDLGAPDSQKQSTDCPFTSLASPAVLKLAVSTPIAIAWAHPTQFVQIRDDELEAVHWPPGSPPTGPPTIV